MILMFYSCEIELIVLSKNDPMWILVATHLFQLAPRVRFLFIMFFGIAL
jgi:hypothetical protein